MTYPLEKGFGTKEEVEAFVKKYDECRKSLLKRIDEEKRGMHKRSLKPVKAFHISSSAVQYRKVV